MNAFGFFLANLAKGLGVRRSRRRWEAVTRERSLLRDAEDLLGKLAWPEAENIDELATEFWRIKELQQQVEKLQVQHEDLDGRTGDLEGRQFDLTDEMEEETRELHSRKEKLHDEEEKCNQAIEEIRGDAELIKKKFDGLKLKLKVFEDDGRTTEECEEIKVQMEEYRSGFELKKEELRAKKADVQRTAKEIEALDETIRGRRGDFDSRTTSLTSELGQHAKRVAKFAAEISGLERQMHQCQATVGNYLSAQSAEDPSMSRKLSKYSQLLSKISKLRKSIDYNQRLASY